MCPIQADDSLYTPCLDEVEKTNTNRCILGVERAMNETEPLNMGMALLIQRAKGEMELVPSAVGPDEMEQRCSCAEVRTLEGVESRGGERAFGAG